MLSYTELVIFWGTLLKMKDPIATAFDLYYGVPVVVFLVINICLWFLAILYHAAFESNCFIFNTPRDFRKPYFLCNREDIWIGLIGSAFFYSLIMAIAWPVTFLATVVVIPLVSLKKFVSFWKSRSEAQDTLLCCNCEHFESFHFILEERIFKQVIKEINKKKVPIPDTRIEEIINQEIRKIRV